MVFCVHFGRKNISFEDNFLRGRLMEWKGFEKWRFERNDGTIDIRLKWRERDEEV